MSSKTAQTDQVWKILLWFKQKVNWCTICNLKWDQSKNDNPTASRQLWYSTNVIMMQQQMRLIVWSYSLDSHKIVFIYTEAFMSRFCQPWGKVEGGFWESIVCDNWIISISPNIKRRKGKNIRGKKKADREKRSDEAFEIITKSAGRKEVLCASQVLKLWQENGKCKNNCFRRWKLS